jgi:hypothetical protein
VCGESADAMEADARRVVANVDYRRRVDGAPRNRASDRLRAIHPNWGNKDHVATRGRGELADNFVHEDRRSLVAVPATGADDYVEQILALHDIRTFRVWIDDVVAVRGQRLALCVRGQTQADTWTTQRLAVVQFDEGVERVERLVNFDLEQRDLALAELDRLHAEIEAGNA